MGGSRTLLSQKWGDNRWNTVNALNEALGAIQSGAADVDLEAVFEGQYKYVSRAIAVIIHDPGRAEELAVEVFLKWSRNGAIHGAKARGWLYKTAVRLALDELRRAARRDRFEGLLASTQNPPTPHAVLSVKQDEERVRTVLAAMPCRQAEMLLLRSQGFDYGELAAALDLNPASIGKLLSRAQQAFRKEYVKRYGEQ
jgi:RNA polymerase sigma-70 factor (ECF subfamily)